ncbi:hypothetical protein CRG98_006870 [Punica granatum]|uniref:Uncharacterized protein n=1 Tax=Punica granatum TaxID=22663 RepID=A0A2I0KWJ6_PUNGR|nr:hypothetical protein CRG98_006870 [Punica granatum]
MAILYLSIVFDPVGSSPFSFSPPALVAGLGFFFEWSITAPPSQAGLLARLRGALGFSSTTDPKFSTRLHLQASPPHFDATLRYLSTFLWWSGVGEEDFLLGCSSPSPSSPSRLWVPLFSNDPRPLLLPLWPALWWRALVVSSLQWRSSRLEAALIARSVVFSIGGGETNSLDPT